MCQGKVEASTHGGADASLLSQQLDGRLALADSLLMSVRVSLAVILYVEKAFHYLGTFNFVAYPLFSAVRRYLSAIAELLCLTERLEEIHTTVQGMISSPHLDATLQYNVLQWWSQYFNICVVASDSEVVEAPGERVPFSLEPILVKL